MKMVRAGRLPAQRRRGHRRHPRHDRDARACRQPRRRRGALTQRAMRRRLRRAHAVVRRPVDHQAVQRRARRGQRHGRPGRAAAVRAAPLPDDPARASTSTARSRTTKPIRSSRRTAATSSSACSPRRRDIGIAWDGDADRCFFIDGKGEFIAGDFVTALLAEAFLIKQPGQTIVYDVRASYAVKDTVAHYGGTALMNRVGHAFFKQRMRDEPTRSSAARSRATTTSATTSTPTTASSRRC